MKPRHWAAALVAAAIAALTANTIVGRLPLPKAEVAHAFVSKRALVRAGLIESQVMPLRAQPEYGDGLGAGRDHEGQDLFAPTGTQLVAIRDAVVLETGSDGGRGNYVSIYSAATRRTYNYFHMLGPALVRDGQRLRAGQQLGRLGCTGSCWGPHLHFELRTGRSPYGQALDPRPLLERISRAGSR